MSSKYYGLKSSKIDIEYLDDFMPHYVKQQKFTRKAVVKNIITADSRYNVYYLLINNIVTCKVTIDKKAYTKSRYYINMAVKLDACDFKYINDFLQQKLTLANSSIIKTLVKNGVIKKETILKYAKAM